MTGQGELTGLVRGATDDRESITVIHRALDLGVTFLTRQHFSSAAIRPRRLLQGTDRIVSGQLRFPEP